jgi:hypothetical protein
MGGPPDAAPGAAPLFELDVQANITIAAIAAAAQRPRCVFKRPLQ